MSGQAEYTYDVFISYSHADKAWVWDELLPRLEGAGLRVCIDDQDFEIGARSLINMERAVDGGRQWTSITFDLTLYRGQRVKVISTSSRRVAGHVGHVRG